MKPLRPSFLWIESVFATIVVAGLIYSFWHVAVYGYFPQPFFYNLNDTWMDWFNPAYWAHQPGTYDSYQSIYPPLTFVILKALTYGPCYVGAEGGGSRACDWYGVATLHATYLVCIVLTVLFFLKIDRCTALPRSIAMAVGLPMLWALDRGNVILFTYIFLLLAYGPLVKSSWMRCVCAGLAVNMKVYLIGTLAAQLLHRRWRWTECAVICTVLIYAATYVTFGSGSPLQIYRNIVDFSSILQIDNPMGIWIASSLIPLGQLAQSNVFPTTLYIGSRNVELIEFLVPAITHGAQAIIMLAAAACYLRPEVVPRYRMLTLSIGIATFTAEVSAYSEILVLLFCFMESGKGLLRRCALIAAYLLCIPLDYDIGSLPQVVADSFITQRTVIVEYAVQIGPFVRPLLMISIPFLLSLVTIIDVVKDIWAGGWSERWRFRHDAPFLPWLQRPAPRVDRKVSR